MAGYVKIWTQLTDDPKFLGLSMNERSGLFQLIVATKKQRDNGTIWVRSMSALAQDWACEVRTARKVLVKLQEMGWCSFEKHPDNTLEVNLHNYKEFQEIDTKEMVRRNRISPVKLQPLRPDQSKAEQTIPYQEVVEHLNLLSGKAYRHTSGNTQRYIRIRWNEGFRLDDFMYVNQIKAEEWLGTEREKYLRPETLYGNKFEGYRQQRRIPRQYSEKTNKALVAAALFLKNKGVVLENSRLTPIDSSNAEVTVGIHQRD